MEIDDRFNANGIDDGRRAYRTAGMFGMNRTAGMFGVTRSAIDVLRRACTGRSKSYASRP